MEGKKEEINGRGISEREVLRRSCLGELLPLGQGFFSGGGGRGVGGERG